MTNQKKFEHSVNILLKAYLNDTLIHGNCHACAVGNLVAHSMGYSYTACVDEPDKRIAYKEALGLYSMKKAGGWFSSVSYFSDSITPLGYTEIESTGYTVQNIVAIEHAFETNKYGDSDDSMFNGLMAVVDVLAEIHEIDLTTVKETKELFV